jgi:tetratricopeptide (TPR) repeat protein
MTKESKIKQWPLYVLAVFIALFVVLAVLFAIVKTPSLLEKSRIFSNDQGNLLISADSEQNPISVPLETLLRSADDLLSSGELTKAMQLYERALELGGSAQVMRRLFETAVLMGDKQKAESVLGLLSFRGVSESTLDALRGMLLLRDGDIEEARMIFDKEPLRPEHVYGLLIADILEGEHDSARERIVQLMQSGDPLLMHSARSLQGAYDEYDLFQDGKTVHLNTLIASVFSQIGQCPNALILLSDVLLEESDYRDAWILKGHCQLMLEDHMNALSSFEHAYSLDPEKAETQYFLGITHEHLEQYEDAKKFLEFALQNRFKPNAIVRQKLALYALNEGNNEEAISHYNAVINGDSSDEVKNESYRELVILMIESGDIEKAHDKALMARDALGDTPDVLELVGWTAMLMGDLDQSATFLNSATLQDPLLATAWYRKGELEERVGDKGQAVSSYRKAYDLSAGVDQELSIIAAEKHNRLVE